MRLLRLFIFLLLPALAGAETLHVSIAVSSEIADRLPSAESIQAGLARLFGAQYGPLLPISFQPAGADRQAPSAKISLGASGESISVSTDFTRGAGTRSLLSTVPAGSPASLLATLAGDIAFLFFASRDFSALPLGPPPALTAVLGTDSLSTLTGWNPEDLEPIGLASSGEEIIVCFPHAFLTLGPLFRITAATISDLFAQSGGREPLQLSGVVAGRGDTLLLLSERQKKIVVANPRLGTRVTVEAPGLSGLGARLLDGRSLAVLPGTQSPSALAVYSLAGAPRRTIAVAGSYLSALARDPEGNLWAWDAGERRIRILAPEGREVFAIKPLFKASTMPLPQQMEVYDDGSFLLAGSGEVWKFRSSGVPVWRLSRIPGRPGEQLPSSFAVALNRSDGSFTLLDGPSRRLLSFSASPAGDAARLAVLLARLDGRRPADLQEAAALARGGSLSLMAWQYGDLLVRAGGRETERSEARVALLRETSELYVRLADGLARDLLFARADGAYLKAAETVRELSAEAPADTTAAPLLDSVLSRRRDARAARAGTSDIRLVSAVLRVDRPQPCAPQLTLLLRLRNTGAEELTQVRVSVSVPSLLSLPGLATVDGLAPGAEWDVQIPFGAAGEELPSTARGIPAAGLITCQRGREGTAAAFSFEAGLVDGGPRPGPAEALACRAVTADPLLAALVGGTPSDPLVALAGLLDSLGAVRTNAANAAAAAVPGSPAPSLRSILRSLPADEPDWSLLSASLTRTLGLKAGLLAVGNRVFAVVGTGIPLARAMASMPGLERFAHVLNALAAEDGTLWAPLSGRVAPRGGSGAAAWAFADALRSLSDEDLGDTRPAALPEAAEPEASLTAVPFPLVLPIGDARATRASVRTRVELLLDPSAVF